MHAAKFVESYIDAWNHSDPKGVAEHLVKNGIYCDIPANQQHSGDALVANLSEFFASGSHSYHLIGDVLSNELSIAFQYRMSSLDGQGDDWFGSPNGKGIRIQPITEIQFDEIRPLIFFGKPNPNPRLSVGLTCKTRARNLGVGFGTPKNQVGATHLFYEFRLIRVPAFAPPPRS